jgi:hypothetical protein
MKFVATLFSATTTTSLANWEKDVRQAISTIPNFLNTGQTAGQLFGLDGTALGSFGFSATSSSSYVVVP